MAYKDPERKKILDKAWLERNRERKAATNKAWYERNRERKATTSKAYRERNRERISIVDKAWLERNRERKATTNKAWRERNRERRAITSKAWRERNRDLDHELKRRRRCKQKNASIPLTANEKEKMLLLERTRQQLQSETGREYHIDHILPITHGGIHHPVNLRILDGRENVSKQDKLFPEAIALAPEHFRLYSERVSPERAWEFVQQLAEGLGLSEDDLDALITGKPLKSKPTLEDFMA
jgi:hypothetical protein